MADYVEYLDPSVYVYQDKEVYKRVQSFYLPSETLEFSPALVYNYRTGVLKGHVFAEKVFKAPISYQAVRQFFLQQCEAKGFVFPHENHKLNRICYKISDPSLFEVEINPLPSNDGSNSFSLIVRDYYIGY